MAFSLSYAKFSIKNIQNYEIPETVTYSTFGLLLFFFLLLHFFSIYVFTISFSQYYETLGFFFYTYKMDLGSVNITRTLSFIILRR